MLRIIGLSILVITTLAGCAVRKTVVGPDYTVVVQEPQTNLVEDFNKNVGNMVYFPYNSSNLTEQAKSTLKRQAAWILANPTAVATIEGYCDERGSVRYNLELGAKRAEAVSRYLVDRGVQEARLRTVTFGKEKPTVVGTEESTYALNRKVITNVTIKATHY